MIPISGFAPDIDSTAEGVLTDCSMLIPTPSGYRSSPSALSAGLPALPSECRGIAVTRNLSNSKRIIAGTQTALFQQVGSSWSDVSRGGGYTVGTENRWRFAQLGDVTLAVNQTDVLQGSSAGAFADVAGAPKARLVETVCGFVMLAGTNEATYGDSPDRWWCSALYDHTSWTPSISTQATTGRLVDSPGDIRALLRLGNDIVVYKERSIFLGRYVGAPAVWAWIQIPGEIGAPSAEAVVNIGSAHIFVGFEDIYLFDGSRPQPIGQAVKQWFFRQVNPSYRHRIIGAYDRARSLVRFYYPSVSSASGALDACLVYHTQTGKWGREDRTIEAAVEYTAAGIAFDSLGTSYATWDSLPDISYDSPFWNSESLAPAVVDAAHALVQLTGIAGEASLTTGDMGDADGFATVTRVTPKFLQAPTSASLSNSYRSVLGEALVPDQTVPLIGGRFDFIRASRWHRVRIATQGDMEITALNPRYVVSGEF